MFKYKHEIKVSNFKFLGTIRNWGKNSPRPIIVKFSKTAKNNVNQAPERHADEQDVRKTSRVREEYPERVRRVRSKLCPF